MATPNLWELLRWDLALKWASPEWYKDLISIMQMDVWSLIWRWGDEEGGGAQLALSVSSPQAHQHPKSPEVFQLSVPASFPSPPVLWIAHRKKKIPEAPKTFKACSLGASRTGLGFLAAEKSLLLQKN